jgi:peptidoglycan/LPS O-acetylase OafA/YrhL
MPPAPPRKLVSLELGRFAAASLVVLSHLIFEASALAAPAVRFSPRWEAAGIFGVEYFFVLSGFVMLTAHAGDFGRAAAVPGYFWHRACRIFPLYWLILPVPLVMFAPAHISAGNLLGVFTLISPDATRYISPAWTLRYELVFYIVFGLALLPVVGRALLAIWIAVIAWSLAPTVLQNTTYHPLRHALRELLTFHPTLLIQGLDMFFITGLAAALAFLKLPLGRRAGLLLIALGAILLLGAAPAVDFYLRYPAGASILAIDGGFAALILGLAALERSGGWSPGGWAGWLGDMSYPLYLLHLPLVLLLISPLYGRLHVSRGGLFLVLGLGLVLVYAGAALLTWGYDRPVRRALRRLDPGRRRAA